MNFKEHIERLTKNDGGLVVRVEFLGADGAAVDVLGEAVVADPLVSDCAFAYVAAGGGRPHGQVIERELWDDEDEGELVLLPGNRALRLSVGPVWTNEHRAVLERWRATPHDWVVPQLREFFDGLRGTPDDHPRRISARQEFRASWKSELGDDGKLHTVGALLLGTDEIVYTRVVSGLETSMRGVIASALTRAPAAEVFGYFIESGNGVSNDWSVPFTISGPNIDFACARLMTRLRLQTKPAAHLRELWLSAWPDTIDYALEEAEAVASSVRQEGFVKYLARLHAIHDEMHRGSVECHRRIERK